MQYDMVVPINGPIPGPMWGSLDPKREIYKFDLDMARKDLALAEVDWKKYLPLIQMDMLGYRMSKDAALLLQNGLNQIGVSSRLDPKTYP